MQYLGTMTQTWTIWCVCGFGIDSYEGKKAVCVKEFKKMGWKKIKGQWMCPSCVKDLRKYPT
jgi:hypothetical protein